MEKRHRQNFIKEIRKQRGLTQKQLGDLVGVADSQITMIENGRRGLRAEMLHRIADALQCHPLDITDGPGNMIAARTEREKELLAQFRELDDAAQAMYSAGLRGLLTEQKKGKQEENKHRKTGAE
jgi:transcriptional regulator with XRE-family HTH domain